MNIDAMIAETDLALKALDTPPPPPKRGIAEDIATHLAVGANKYLALPLAGITEMAGRATGIKPIEDAGKTFGNNAESWIAQKEQEDPSQKFRDISNVGDAARWAGEQVLEFAPQAVIGLATGGAGAAAGRVAAGGLARASITSIEDIAGKKAIQAAVANTGRSLTTKELGILAADRAGTAGAIAATGAGSVAMESSTIYRDQKPEEKDMGRALLFGTAAGILDTAFPAYLMKKTGLTKIMPGMGKVSGEAEALTGKTALTGVQRVKDTAKVAGLGIGEETVQEGVQTVLENIGANKQVYSDEVNKAGGNFGAFLKVAAEKGISAAVHPEAWNDIIESMAAGGLIGGVMGGGSSATGHVSDVIQQRGQQQTPTEDVNALNQQNQPSTGIVTGANASTGNILQDSSSTASDSIPERWPVDSGRDLSITATPTTERALERALTAGGIAVPQAASVQQGVYENALAAGGVTDIAMPIPEPSATPPAHPAVSALASGNMAGFLTSLGYPKIKNADHFETGGIGATNNGIYTSPPMPKQTADALAQNADAAGLSSAIHPFIMTRKKLDGTLESVPSSSGKVVVTIQPKQEITANGPTDSVPSLPGTTSVDGSGMVVPEVQTKNNGAGSDNAQSGGNVNGLSNMQKEVNGQEEKMPDLRSKTVAAKPANVRRQLDTSKDSLIVAIAKMGGISRDDIDKHTGVGKDLTHTLNSLATKEAKAGILHVISKKGRPLDEMRIALVENGYLDESADINTLLVKLDDSQRGTTHRSTHSSEVGTDAYREAENRYAEMIDSMTDEEYEEFNRNQWLDEQSQELAEVSDYLDEYIDELNNETMTTADWLAFENEIKEAIDATEFSQENSSEDKGQMQEDATREKKSISPVSESNAASEGTTDAGKGGKIDRFAALRVKHLAKLKAEMLAAKEPKARKALQDRITKMKERTGVVDGPATVAIKTIEDEINSMSLDDMAALFDEVTAVAQPVRTQSKAKKHEEFLKRVISKAKPENKARVQKALDKHKAKQEARKETPPPIDSHPAKPERDNQETPYFKEGDRVQDNNGKHGEISRANSFVGHVLTYGTAPSEASKRYTHSYDVIWDNGVKGYGSFDDMNHESDPAPTVVPAPKHNDAFVEPDQLLRNVAYSRKQAQSSRNAAERAKKKENIAGHKKEALVLDEIADEQQAAFNAWANKYPDEADKYREKAEASKPKIEPVAGMKVSFNSAQGGIELRFDGKPDDAVIRQIKAQGFQWAFRKKVWYVKDTPERRTFVEGLQGEAAKPVKIELADNEVQVADNPYIYKKSDGAWYWKSSPKAHADSYTRIANIPFEFQNKLETALADKSVAEEAAPAPVNRGKMEYNSFMSEVFDILNANTELRAQAASNSLPELFEIPYRQAYRRAVADVAREYIDKGFDVVEASDLATKNDHKTLSDKYKEAVRKESKATQEPDYEAWWDNELSVFGRRQIADGMKGNKVAIAATAWRHLAPETKDYLSKYIHGNGNDPVIFEQSVNSNSEEYRHYLEPKADTRGASDILKAAADSGVKGAGEALKGLFEIFGGSSLKSFPGTVDEETYSKAKPHFVAAYNNFKESGKQLTEFFQFIAKQFGNAIKPYLMRFMDDVKNGNHAIIEENTEEVVNVNSAREEAGADDRVIAERTGTSDVQGSGEGQDITEVPGKVRGGDGSIVLGSIRGNGTEETQVLGDGVSAGDGAGTTRNMGSDPSGVSGILRSGTAGDLRIPAGGLERTGSWKDTASRNLDIVELIKTLREENRMATADEQLLLMKYVGWGAGEIRNKIFPGYAEQGRIIPNWADVNWKPLVARLDTALTPEELKTATRSSQYAHYTSEAITRSMWKAFERMGFLGGKVFEPGPGTGNFMGTMPDGIYANSKYTGIEMDNITAAIAQQLYPLQNIIHGDYTKQKFPGNFFDVAIGNPPFSSTTVLTDPDYKKHKFSLHDFFFAKTIDKVRPGGLMAFVTSRYTMDKLDDKARAYLSERADLLGAIRLPQTAFKQHSGTEVVTDVIFLRKRAEGEEAAGHAWSKAADIQIGDQVKQINEYFVDHPEMVLGTHVTERGQFSQNDYSVKPIEGDIEQLFAAAVQNLPANVYSAMRQDPKAIKQIVVERDFNPKNKKEGGIYLSGKGEIMRVENGSGVPLSSMVKLSAKQQAWMIDYLPLRDLMKQARFDQFHDSGWEKSLKELNKAYDSFVKKHGNIREFILKEKIEKNEDGVDEKITTRNYVWEKTAFHDVEGPLLFSLEDINDDGDISKASFLTGRTVMKPVRSTNPQSMGDALALSLDEIGMLDLDHIAGLMKLSRAETIESLGDMIYETPSGEYLLADEYLSGDVVTKLAEAEQAARSDEKFRANVKALTEVQPKPLTPGQITAGLGMAWIPTDIVGEFAQEVMGLGVRIERHAATNSWKVSMTNVPAQGYGRRRSSKAPGAQSLRSATAEWGTPDRGTNEILDAVLNQRPLRITVKDMDGKVSADPAATARVNEIADKMRTEFRSWIWTDAERAGEMLDLYNKKYNNLAPRRFDGSHLTLPGIATKYKLHPHQKRAIWRMIQTGNTYLAHAVGAGKTLEMIAAGMEMKRLGMINKPLYVVPNDQLAQWSSEFMDAYPLANIMVADELNFDLKNRKRFMAQAAMNAPDAIIITQSALGKLRMKPESVAPVKEKMLQAMREALSEAQDDDAPRHLISKMERMIENAEQRFDSIVEDGKGDNIITYEELGADFLFVDEAHKFRKLDFTTVQQVKGIDPVGSRTALDLFLKTNWMEHQKPGRSHVFASGTPVTNTMGELYNVMRFFMEEEMERDDIGHFDAWAAMFGQTAMDYELNAAGKYEPVSRFAKFNNLPELMKRVRTFMDVLTSSHLGAYVVRPDIKGGKPDMIIATPSNELKAYQTNVLQPRMKRAREWKPSKDEPGNPDPIINIITDGRLSSIDMRLVGSTRNDPDSKLNRVIDEIIRVYKESKDNTYNGVDGKPSAIKGGTQVVFYNHGFGANVAKSRGFDARAWINQRLKAEGIPLSEVAWFDEYDTSAKQLSVMKDVREGRKKIIIGHARSLGVGKNLQTRLYALHYIDPPWYPADVEQPHGRIIRQGNQNKEIVIDWYSTKGSYDSTMWQMVGRKGRFIEQAFMGDDNLRTMEDISEVSQYEMARALSSGDERVIKLVGLQADVERYSRLKEAHFQQQSQLRSDKNNTEWNISSYTKSIAKLKEAVKVVGGYVSGSSFKGMVGKQIFDKPGEFGTAVITAYNNAVMELQNNLPDGDHKEVWTDSKQYGSINGIPLIARVFHSVLVTQYTNIARITKDIEEDVDSNMMMYPQGTDGAGLARRIFNRLNDVAEDLRRTESIIADDEAKLKTIVKRIGAPFEHEAVFNEKIAELSTLQAELTQEEAKPKEVAGENTSFALRDISYFNKGVQADEAQVWVSTLPIAKQVKVWQTPADLKAANPTAYNQIEIAKVDPARVQAMEYNGTIHVITGNIQDMQRVKALVIGHELAHAGQTKKIVDLAVDWFKRTAGSKTEATKQAHRKLEQIAILYGYDLADEKQFRRAVQEATAALAEQVADGSIKPTGLMQRLFMYIKHWLRQNGLISHVSDSEISLAVAEMLRIGERRLSVGRGGDVSMMALIESSMDKVKKIVFGKTGEKVNDYVTVNGSPDIWTLPIVNKNFQDKYPPLPIRIKNGKHFKNTDNGGFGIDHLVKRHGDDISAIGLSPEQYIYYMIRTTSKIWEAEDGKKLILRSVGKPSGSVFIELRKENSGYYSVVTAYDRQPTGELIWSGRPAGIVPALMPNRVTSTPPTTDQSARSFSQTDHGQILPKPARDGLENQIDYNSTPIDEDVKAQFALVDQAISQHAAKINAPEKVTNMVKSLIEIVGQSIPERLKANIGKILSNPWFGSEGKPIRRHVVNLNLERSQNRNGIISDLFQTSEGYTGVEGLDNILKKASKEEVKLFNDLIKHSDENGVAKTFTRDELYRGKTKFGKVPDTVVKAYKAFHEVMQAANRVRFQQLDELSLLPYKDQEWFTDLVDLLNKNMERASGLDEKEASELHRLIRSLKRNLTNEELASGENPAKIKASPAVIAAYRDFWKQVDQTEKRHQGNMLSAFRDILGYRGELDKLKKEWGNLKGYAPRNRKDGDWHVSVYATNEEGERVKVYMKPTLTETGAKSLKKEVQADLKKHLKGNFEAGTTYEVEYERNKATPSELLAWKGSEVAVEALLNQAFDRAGVTGKMSVEEWQSLKHEVFQEIAKEIMAQGFGRHGIQREKTMIEGYDDADYQTVLKEYISGMSGWLSKMRFAIETTSAAKDISKADPSDKVWVNDYVQDAMKNSTYMDELAATARSVGAVYYLGFKVSSALLNAFQNYTVGQAELSLMIKKAGLKDSAIVELAKAQKDVMADFINIKKGGTGTLTKEEHDVLFRAVREGTAQAQAIRQISGTQEMGFGTGWKKFTELSMTPFQFVEQRLNREPAILAAYRIFKKSAAGTIDEAAYKQAETFVNNTHYVMGKENLPEMVRKLGPLGKTAYLFQGYVHNYIHWMFNRAKDGEFATIARSLGAIAALGGVFALPGADDMDRWIMKWFGVSYKMKFKKFVKDTAGNSTPGQIVQNFVNHGVTSVAGVDMSRALAVNIPFISDPEKTFGERIGGAWGGLLQKPGMALKAANKGDYVRAVENLLPEFAANPMRAMRQYNQGATTLGGKPIFDETGRQVKYSGTDVAKKMLGFNPMDISDRTNLKSDERDLNAYWKSERDDALAKIRRAKNSDDMKDAVRGVIKYNTGLRKSQAFGLVPIIKAESIQKSRTFKPQKKTLSWERNHIE